MSTAGSRARPSRRSRRTSPPPAHEEALIHSATLKADDPAFSAAIQGVKSAVSAVLGGRERVGAGRPRQRGLVSKDEHSALVTFDIKGDAESAGDRVEPTEVAVRAAQKANPQLRIEQFGDASVGRRSTPRSTTT